LNAQPKQTFFQRAAFHQELFAKAPYTINDDTWSFNSQVSTQWDGLRHFGYQDEKLFYGGISQGDIHHIDEAGERSTILGIHGMFTSSSASRFLFDAVYGTRYMHG
jgi:hypothetical protein